MTIWVLMVFNFSMGHATLATKDFYTKEACIAAAATIMESENAVKDSPAEKVLTVNCIEDKAPNK